MYKKRRILLKFARDTLGQKPCLQLDTTPVGRFVAKDGMVHLFVEPLFQFGKKHLAPFILEPIGSHLDHKVVRCHHAVVEERHTTESTMTGRNSSMISNAKAGRP